MAKEPPIQTVITPTIAQLKARYAKQLTEVKKLDKPHNRISVYLDSWVQRNFKTEGGKVGGWLPLRAGGRWIAGKGLDTSAKILQDTGRLRISFIPFATKLNAGIGSDVPYSRQHDEGLEGLPQRRILPRHSDKEVKDAARAIYVRHIKESTNS